MHRRLVAALAALALLLPASVAGAAEAAQDVSAADRTRAERVVEAVLYEEHDRQRRAGSSRGGQQYGDVASTSGLTGYTDVQTVARRWSDRMLAGEFQHNPDFHRQFGHWRGAGENIAYRTAGRADSPLSDADLRDAAMGLLDQWWNSTGHRTSWMNPTFDHVGIGVAIGTTELSGRDYWVVYATVNLRDHDGSRVTAGAPFAPDGQLPPQEGSARTTAEASEHPVPTARDIDDTCAGRDGVEFDDVPSSAVFAPTIDCITAYDLTRGATPTTYEPRGTVTVGQLAAFTKRMLEAGGAPVDADPSNCSSGTMFDADLDVMVELGVLTPAECGSAARTATRSQLASFVVGALQHAGATPTSTPPDYFSDDDGDRFEAAHDVVADMGIVTGQGGAIFDGGSAVTRAQMSLFLAAGLDALLDA